MSDKLLFFGFGQWTVLVASASSGLDPMESLAECGTRDLVYLRSASDGQILGGLSGLNG